MEDKIEEPRHKNNRELVQFMRVKVQNEVPRKHQKRQHPKGVSRQQEHGESKMKTPSSED
jgi:hypothetical protein